MPAITLGPAAPLGPAQVQTLAVLRRSHRRAEAPLTSAEIADYLHENTPSGYRRRTAEAEAVSATLRRLEKRCLAERLGKSSTGAWCWAITGPGCRALDAARARGTEGPG